MTISLKANWVLVIEDDEQLAEMLKADIEEHGYRVITCKESSRASMIMQNQKFACIVFDHGLKGMGGSNLVVHIKKTPHHLNYTTPFIFMSGTPNSELLKLLAKDIQGAFVKPFSTQDLINKIKSLAPLIQVHLA